MATVPDHPRRVQARLLALPVAVLLSASCSTARDAHGSATASSPPPSATAPVQPPAAGDVTRALEQLPVKGRAAKTGYTRAQFGDGWAQLGGCDVRDRILAQQLTHVRYDPAHGGRCTVLQGDLADPYTAKTIHYVRGGQYINSVDIDHIVPLGDAWQTGAQQLTAQRRTQFANDPRNLQAVDPSANRTKGDSDAATWLPNNKAFRCTYVSTQIAVKAAYGLWVTPAEKAGMLRVLSSCPARRAGQPQSP